MSLTKAQRAALDALPPKRRAFVLALVGEAAGNQTEAARIAGYAKPKEEGSRLLTFAAVAECVEALRAPRENAAIASREERLEWLSALMRGDVEAEAMPRDRIKAAELIARMSGDMIERREVEHTGQTAQIQVLIAQSELVQLAAGTPLAALAASTGTRGGVALTQNRAGDVDADAEPQEVE